MLFSCMLVMWCAEHPQSAPLLTPHSGRSASSKKIAESEALSSTGVKDLVAVVSSIVSAMLSGQNVFKFLY